MPRIYHDPCWKIKKECQSLPSSHLSETWGWGRLQWGHIASNIPLHPCEIFLEILKMHKYGTVSSPLCGTGWKTHTVKMSSCLLHKHYFLSWFLAHSQYFLPVCGHSQSNVNSCFRVGEHLTVEMQIYCSKAFVSCFTSVDSKQEYLQTFLNCLHSSAFLWSKHLHILQLSCF